MASLRKASLLPPKDLRAFMQANRKLRAKTAPLRAEMTRLKNQIREIPGAPALLKKLADRWKDKVQPLARDAKAMLRALINRI